MSLESFYKIQKKVKRALLADSRVGRSYNQPKAINTTKESGDASGYD